MFKPRKTPSFVVSILTAIGTGIVFAFLVISGSKLIFETFLIPNFSKSLYYISTNTAAVFDGREVIRSVKEFISRDEDSISATSYIVTSLEDKKVLFQKGADTSLPIASLTKLVTAVVATKLMEGHQMVEINKNILDTNGNTAHFRLGEKFTFEEILYPLLMVSSNDAAEALARSYGREEFIKAMNDWTNSIGAYRTYFKDPSGLSVKNVSTARDISIIVDWIYKNRPDLLEITHTKSKTIRVHTWTNPTSLLNLSIYIGGKNGYTPEANRTGASLFKVGKPEKVYSVVVLGSSNRDDDIMVALDKALDRK